MAKTKIQNLYLDPETKAGSELLDYYQNTVGGSKGGRIRDLVYVGWALRRLSPTLCQVLASMTEEGTEITSEKLKMLIDVVGTSDDEEPAKTPVDTVENVAKPEPKGGVFELSK